MWTKKAASNTTATVTATEGRTIRASMGFTYKVNREGMVFSWHQREDETSGLAVLYGTRRAREIGIPPTAVAAWRARSKIGSHRKPFVTDKPSSHPSFYAGTAPRIRLTRGNSGSTVNYNLRNPTSG